MKVDTKQKFNFLIAFFLVLTVVYINTTEFVRKQLLHKRIKMYILNYVVLFFIFMFLYITLYTSYSNGALITFFTWAFFAGITPTPDSGFLISFPLKFFKDVSLMYSQCVVSLISWIIVYIFHKFKKDWLNTFYFGRLANKILSSKQYHIYLICFVSTTILSYLLDMMVDYVDGKIPLYKITSRNSMMNIVMLLCISLILILTYTYETNRIMKH